MFYRSKEKLYPPVSGSYPAEIVPAIVDYQRLADIRKFVPNTLGSYGPTL